MTTIDVVSNSAESFDLSQIESRLTLVDQKTSKLRSTLKESNQPIDASLDVFEYIAIDDLEKIGQFLPPIASHLEASISKKFDELDFWLKNFINFLFVNDLLISVPTLASKNEFKGPLSDLAFENMQRILNSLSFSQRDPLFEKNLKKCVHASNPFAAFSHHVLDLYANEIAGNYINSSCDPILFEKEFTLFKGIRSFYLRSSSGNSSGLFELLYLFNACKKSAFLDEKSSLEFISPTSLDDEIKQILGNTPHLSERELKALLRCCFFGDISEGCGFYKNRDEFFYNAKKTSIVYFNSRSLFQDEYLNFVLHQIEKQSNPKLKFDCYLTLYDIVAGQNESFCKDIAKVYLDKCLEIAPFISQRRSKQRAFKILSQLYEQIGEDKISKLCSQKGSSK